MTIKNDIQEIYEVYSKNIYDLELHETTIIEAIVVKNGAYPTKWQVTRVPGGWFYRDANPHRTTVSEFFVPFNNEFK